MTLGQQFLEKIVQINFRIPRADSKLIESFVDANLGSLSEEPAEKPREEARAEAEQLIEAEQKAGKPLDEAVEVVKAARPDMSQETVTEAKQEVFARSFDDSEDVKRAIYEAVPYLECNPRKIKRFINVGSLGFHGEGPHIGVLLSSGKPMIAFKELAQNVGGTFASILSSN